MIAPRIDPGQREFAGPAAEAADLAFFAGAMRARAGIVLPESKAALIYRRLAPRVRELGFDEHFLRVWEFYLAYCEAAFDEGSTDVMQFTLRKA